MTDPSVRRLSWAGIEMVAGDFRLLIDPLTHVEPLKTLGLGEPRTPIVSAGDAESADIALVTHRHPDHFDPFTLRRVLRPGGVVACPEAMQKSVEGDGLPARGMVHHEPFISGPVEIYAVPAVDGLGDVQVSWVVLHDRLRLFHGGDTMWHGYWWSLAREYGPFDLACLPINGPIVAFRGWEGSPIPAALTPDQAVTAARLLNAQVLCPIHYGTFNHPPVYAEHPDCARETVARGEMAGVEVRLAEPGEIVWSAPDAE